MYVLRRFPVVCQMSDDRFCIKFNLRFFSKDSVWENRLLTQILANICIYWAINFAGMYTKYLTDRSQRKAFIETYKSMETRYKTHLENDKQEKLLLSGETPVIVCDPRKDPKQTKTARSL